MKNLELTSFLRQVWAEEQKMKDFCNDKVAYTELHKGYDIDLQYLDAMENLAHRGRMHTDPEIVTVGNLFEKVMNTMISKHYTGRNTKNYSDIFARFEEFFGILTKKQEQAER